MNMADLTGLGSVADLASTVIGRIWPDKTEQEKAQLAAAVSLVQGQLQVNQAEASNPSVFVAGWRPFIGWVCGAALVYHYILRPMLPWLLALFGKPVPAIPPLDMGDLITILLGMLGLGGLRTYEKKQGVA
jgi:hypothetical protein